MPTIYKPKRQRMYNSANRKDRQRIYQTERWRQLRASKLATNPLCELCEENGIITPAEDVHHKVSFMTTNDKAKRIRLAYDRANLECLCRACHQYRHYQVSEEDTPWGKM